MDFLFKKYEEEKSKHFPGTKTIDIHHDMATIICILDELLKQSDVKQIAAIEKIKDYAEQVGRLYT